MRVKEGYVIGHVKHNKYRLYIEYVYWGLQGLNVQMLNNMAPVALFNLWRWCVSVCYAVLTLQRVYRG